MARYRKAERLLFSEGSAIHALQLLGSLTARVTILRRRARHQIAKAALERRVSSVDYIDCLGGLIFGARPNGGPQRSSGMSVLDPARCVAAFAGAGIDIARVWDGEAYTALRDQDILDWMAYRRNWPRPETELPFIRKGLATAGIVIDP